MMLLNRRELILAGTAAALAGCTDAIPRRSAQSRADVPEGAIGIVTTPNPHVFPFLLAMILEPDLPVRLLPIAEAADADSRFAAGEADAMLAMTYMGARKRMSGAIPDLRLHTVTTWRGFFEVTGEGVRSFADLRGKTVVVSGPLGSGRGGGGDVIFQAAARRQGVDPSRDLAVEYLPASQGVERVASGQVAGITLPSPGNTGLVMRSRMAQKPVGGAMMRMLGRSGPSVPLASSIDFQQIFSGFGSFPAGQLPIGGLHVSERSLAREDKRAKMERIAQAYRRAAGRLAADPSRHAGQIVEAFEGHFKALGSATPPATLISRSIEAGDLVYRGDIPVDAVREDLSAWLDEVIGRKIDPDFLAKA